MLWGQLRLRLEGGERTRGESPLKIFKKEKVQQKGGFVKTKKKHRNLIQVLEYACACTLSARIHARTLARVHNPFLLFLGFGDS